MVDGPSWYNLWKQTEQFSYPLENTDIVPLVELKKHARAPFDDPDYTYDDDTFRAFSRAAERLIELTAEITIRTKVLNLTLARWPRYSDYLILRLERPPVNSIVHLKYYDTSDVQQTMNSSLYSLWKETGPPQLIIRAENVPTLSTQRDKVVEIQYSAGNTIIEPQAKLAIMELTSFWFKNREAFNRMPASTEGAEGQMFQALLDSLRWRLYP